VRSTVDLPTHIKPVMAQRGDETPGAPVAKRRVIAQKMAADDVLGRGVAGAAIGFLGRVGLQQPT
jgi:hypothetical protein